jgi:hypothetical protein
MMARLQVSANESLKAISSCNCCRKKFLKQRKKPIKRFPGCCYERDQPQNHRPSAKKLRTNPEPNRPREQRTVRLGIFLVIIYKKVKQNKFQNQEGQGRLRSLQCIKITSGEE